VIKYAKQQSNRAAKRHCGPPAIEKMICEWRKLEQKLQLLEKNKLSFYTHIAKWHDLEAEMQKWITDHRNNRNSVYKNYHF
jgi:hypothetical protein